MPSFTKEYVKFILLNHILEYIIIISQIYFIKVNNKNNELVNNTIRLTLCFLSGILLFFYMLVFLGRTYYKPGEYWIIHADLHVIYDIALCSFIFIMLNLMLRYNIMKKIYVTITFFIVSIVLLFNNYIEYKKILNDELLKFRIDTYKSEKIIRLANIHVKTALLDKKCFENSYNWALFYDYDDRKENYPYPTSLYIEYLNLFEKDENKITNKFIFTDEEAVNKAFTENGGIFTEEELKNPNFNKLLDKNFLLNKE